MKIGVHPGGASRAVIGAHVRRRAVGQDVILDRRRALADLKKRTRIAGRALLHNLGLVLVELLVGVREPDIDCIDPEAAAEHPPIQRMPGQADARLEILVDLGCSILPWDE